MANPNHGIRGANGEHDGSSFMGEWGRVGISRWLAMLSPAAFLLNNRNPQEYYEMASLKVANASRELDALRRRQGRYLRRRNQALKEIKRENPNIGHITWSELHGEVKLHRVHIKYDSSGEDAKNYATIRTEKANAYEKRPVARRHGKRQSSAPYYERRMDSPEKPDAQNILARNKT